VVSGLRRLLGRASVLAAYAAPLALVAWGLWLGVSSPEASGRVLRLGHSLNRDHPVHKGMEFMAADLERRSNGQLRVEIYANEQLGPERDLIELLQIGSLAMTKVSTAPLENFSPLLRVFSLPFLFRDHHHFWQMADGPIGRELLDASIPYRLKGLTYFDAGSRSFYVSQKRNRVVRRPEDLDGLSIRVMRSRTAMRMVELLGAKPVPIPFGELYTALDTGTVDGAENNPPSLYTTRQYEVTASYTLDEHATIPDILIIGTGTWNRLSRQEQDWLQASADAASVYQRGLWARAEQEMLATIEDSGVVVVRDVDREAFRERTAALYEEPEFAQPEVQALIRRIQAVGGAPVEPEAEGGTS
jgi:tripartite ATP-independent transporter DctP family solute receptor